ncbi:unnamed protein product [Menidia menidia]|uniref:(Atlantic silverside) hypothetical protein n=1 Tax=Menidia menidia TaxID=238744 RepID=A0A8S4B194_9TELE|nr:unnamed protein product [Menidia menidia]
MNILLVLGLLHLLPVPALTLTRPVNDYWGEFGAYGPCSRTCGTGVAMRTRKCITSRTDGGHNCEGSSKSYRTCNTHECPVGSRDFREDQCSEFDGMEFQRKRHSWVPYYGASNPCELNCVPRGQNFFYRHRPKVVDGTPCYVGRTDICVDGICRVLTHGEFMGIDNDTNSVHSSTPVAVAPHPRDTFTYIYRAGVYGECSATCNGGMQYRSVECLVQDPSNPRVVDESYCITQRLPRPASQQACNTHPCTAEYSVSSFSVCSATCGEGQQTREVFCVGPNGEHMPDHACRGLARPPSVQACRRPACHLHITWHVTEYGLCSRSCGGGSRAETRDLYPPVTGPHCAQSLFGCCPDSHTPASGPRGQGCTEEDCVRSRYGCCSDGVTPAQGTGRSGCPEYQTVQHPSSSAHSSTGAVCSLPRDEGPCDTWTVRFTYDSRMGKCTEFWYGGCHGNANNFMSLEACQRECGGVRREPASTPRRESSVRGSLGGIARARAQRSRAQRRA